MLRSLQIITRIIDELYIETSICNLANYPRLTLPSGFDNLSNPTQSNVQIGQGKAQTVY